MGLKSDQKDLKFASNIDLIRNIRLCLQSIVLKAIFNLQNMLLIFFKGPADFSMFCSLPMCF